MTVISENPKKVFCKKCKYLRGLPVDNMDATAALLLGFCAECYPWHRMEVIKDSPDTARVGGCHYIIGPETSLEKDPKKFRGFGGQLYQIRFFSDGRIVRSTNLWCQGTIPKQWREELPDNAQFITE